MRVFSNVPRFPQALASKSEKTSNSNEAGASPTPPPGTDSNGFAQKAAFLRSRGGALGLKLANLFKSTKPVRNVSQGAPDAGELLRQSIGLSHAKFSKQKAGIEQALDAWHGTGDSLESLLKPYIMAARQGAGVPSRDGLRSGVTGLFNGIENERSGASEDLRTAAQTLRDTVIFKAHAEDGTLKSYTLMNFATTGELGIRSIDNLNIPKAQREEITRRLSLALDELHELGKAYVAQTALAPARRMDDSQYVLVTSDSALQLLDNAIPLRRRSALRSPPNARRMAPTRSIPQAANALQRPDAVQPAMRNAVRPAAQATVFSSGSIELDRLIADAGNYLNPNELQDVFDGTRTLHEMADTIAARANLRRAGQPEVVNAASVMPHAAAASPSSSEDRDSLMLMENARRYLTPEELRRAINGDLDLLDMVHVIQHRVEDGALHGEYLPAYTEHDPASGGSPRPSGRSS